MTRARTQALSTPKSRRRREELLVAARATFEERGYFDTRVADIVRRASVSHGTFYEYFTSKDDVLRALFAELVDDLFVASGAPIERDATPYLTLQSTIRQFMHAYRDRAAMIRLLEQAVSVSDDYLELRLRIRARFGERLEAEIRRHQAAHDVKVDLDPELAAYALGGMVEDFARGCYVLKQLVVEEDAIATLSLIWARAIGLPTQIP